MQGKRNSWRDVQATRRESVERKEGAERPQEENYKEADKREQEERGTPRRG